MMRYAIYFAPQQASLFDTLGSSWLGRTAYGDKSVPQPAISDLAAATSEPMRYGFHATLKAPFSLKPGQRRTVLGEKTQQLAKQLNQVTIAKLTLTAEHGFIALVPEQRQITVAQLADRCVRELDEFRDEEDEDRLARRRIGLSERQRKYLDAWGYPYVFEDFNLHFSLTKALGAADLERLLPEARKHFAPVIGRSLKIDSLSIFVEPVPGANFIIEEQFPIRSTLRTTST